MPAKDNFRVAIYHQRYVSGGCRKHPWAGTSQISCRLFLLREVRLKRPSLVDLFMPDNLVVLLGYYNLLFLFYGQLIYVNENTHMLADSVVYLSS